jgi:F420-non-reducing hydrogenase small subunit
MGKLKFALYWAAGCGGCDVSILDTHEKILEVPAVADIVFWPIVLDFKYHDVEAMPDKHIDVCLINGAVRTSENEHLVRLLRKKSKVIVAHGSCACFGGIPGLINFSNKANLFKRVYEDTPTTVNPDKTTPQVSWKAPEGGTLELPEFYDRVYSVPQIIDVEYYMPGCPPTPDQFLAALEAIKTGKLPPVGSSIAGTKTLCDECEREKKEKKVARWKRVCEGVPDRKECLMDQGYMCMGPATRGGCKTRCIKGNMPCEGCFGPPDHVADQGAAYLSAMASVTEAKTEKEAQEKLKDIMLDPAGLFYRFTLPVSLRFQMKEKKPDTLRH